jgi:hypothetical protein
MRVWELEASMHVYEIRVLRADRSTAAVIEVMHLNDGAAIRSARHIAGGRPFEVWRGLECVHGRGPAVRQSGLRAPQPAGTAPGDFNPP